MRRLRSISMLVLAAGILAHAPARAATPEQDATQIAQEWARAIMSGDIDAEMKLLPATMYGKPGERERARLQRLHAKEVAQVNNKKVIAFDVRAPAQTLKIEKTTAVVIPYQMIVAVPEGKMQTDSVLVAVSDESGSKWSIFEGSAQSARTLKQLIPGYTTGLNVPPAQSKLIKGQ